MKKPKNVKLAAKLMVLGPGKMSKRGRRDIAEWLRKQASFLVKYGDEYTEKRFTASYNYKR